MAKRQLSEHQRAVDPATWPDPSHRIKSLEEALRYLLQAPEFEPGEEISLYTLRAIKTARNILEATP